MEPNELAAIGYAVTTAVYLLLTVVLLSRWRDSRNFQILALATSASVLWAGAWTAQNLGFWQSNIITALVEWTRCLAWLIVLVAILREIDANRFIRRVMSRYGLLVLLLAGIPVVYYLIRTADFMWPSAWIAGGYALSLPIIFATEQLYRNAPVDSTSGVNYFCIAVAGMFLYDVLLYGLVVAGVSVGSEYWSARGFVNALFAAPLALGIWRTFRISLDAQFPRQIVIYSFGFTVMVLYVAIAIVGHYYIRAYGGSWSEVGSVVLVVAAIAAAAVILASATTRARVRVLLMKTFFQFKYDYRKEWLRFISTLSESGLENVAATAVRAVAQIVNSPGGAVWTQEQEGIAYLPAGSWRCAIPNVAPIAGDSGLVKFLQNRQWVIDLEELQRYPDRYADLKLDDWLKNDGDWWLIVPLFLGKHLYGFAVLQKPRVVPSLNFEDHDLLRTVGRHVGMHINQAESDNRLAESRQFGAYNRLTAFLMHDLNNLIAQQSLVVKNAERFRQNPKFVDDAIDTIAHSVSRMKRLMEQLSSGSKAPASRQTDVGEALTKAVERCQTLKPTPHLDIGETPILIQADPERLITVFEHLIRNAQHATPPDGRIAVKASAENGIATVSITDTGEGMSPEFIRERLFRPFDSTKGSGSMGIGAYQARDYVRTMGGRMTVSSTVGVGTEFSIRLQTDE